MAKKCCDTCRHFQFAGEKIKDQAVGICNAPQPPWMRGVFMALGTGIARMESSDGKNCAVYESDSGPTPSRT